MKQTLGGGDTRTRLSLKQIAYFILLSSVAVCVDSKVLAYQKQMLDLLNGARQPPLQPLCLNE